MNASPIAGIPVVVCDAIADDGFALVSSDEIFVNDALAKQMRETDDPEGLLSSIRCARIPSRHEMMKELLKPPPVRPIEFKPPPAFRSYWPYLR